MLHHGLVTAAVGLRGLAAPAEDDEVGFLLGRRFDDAFGGTAADPVRLASGGSVASQTYYSASLTFGTLGAASCAEASVDAAGVTPGETLAAGLPGALPTGIVGMVYSGADVVVVRLCNVTAAAIAVPDGLIYSARVVRGF